MSIYQAEDYNPFTEVARRRAMQKSYSNRSQSSAGSSNGSGRSGAHKLPLSVRKIRHEIHKLDIFANLRQAALDDVSRSIYCISESFRMAHLIDTVKVKPADHAPLAAALGKGLESNPTELAILYESTTEQTFIISVTRFVEIYECIAGGAVCPLKQYYVRVSSPEAELLLGRPQFLLDSMKAINDLIVSTQAPAKGAPLRIFNITSLLKSEIGKAREMVTLAGALLCYPVVYVLDTNLSDTPESSAIQAPALKQPLWIGKLVLEGIDARNDHVLLQSTFPTSLFRFHDVDDRSVIESSLPTLSNIRDRAQHFLTDKLDTSAGIGEIWSDLSILIEGPITLDQVVI